MPANVGEMFYYGDVPWHGQGKKLDQPANLEEAIRAGGLDWDVDMVPLCTKENPPSPVTSRLAIVRQDRREPMSTAVSTTCTKRGSKASKKPAVRLAACD